MFMYRIREWLVGWIILTLSRFCTFSPLLTVLYIQELTFELSEIYMDSLELKQKKFERTAGDLDPKLLQKMVCRTFLGKVFDPFPPLTKYCVTCSVSEGFLLFYWNTTL